MVQLVHLWHNSMVKLCAVETERTCCPVERAANIIALVSTFHFLLFLDLFSQIDLNPQERLPSFFQDRPCDQQMEIGILSVPK